MPVQVYSHKDAVGFGWILPKCKKCKEEVSDVGNKTKMCLECLDKEVIKSRK